MQISQVKNSRPKLKVAFAGTIIDSTGVKVSQKGNEYIKFEVGDETDTNRCATVSTVREITV